MSKQEIVKRYVLFLIGLFINSFGVSFITKASLGTSPISSIPYTLSLKFSPTLGMFTLYMSVILIIIQMILLQKKFPKEYLLQIPISFLFSWFIDLTMELLQSMTLDTYFLKMISLLLGCLILGAGVYLEMAANVVMLPGESFVRAICVTFHKDFGKTKVVFDVSLSFIAGILSVVYFQKLAGVREGTIIAALLVGLIARYLKRKLTFVDAFLTTNESTEVNEQIASQNKQIVITISREYGSGGRKIAEALANKLGLEFYDKSIIEKTAKDSNLSEAFVEEKEQTMTNSFIYDLISQYQVNLEEKTKLDQLFESESKIVKEAAERGNCVILGRCADYILKDFDNCCHIFMHAKEEFKVQEIAVREHMEKSEALKHMRAINKRRQIHYKYYTGRTWGVSANYNLSLDVSALEIEEAVDIIKEYVKCSDKRQELE